MRRTDWKPRCFSTSHGMSSGFRTDSVTAGGHEEEGGYRRRRGSRRGRRRKRSRWIVGGGGRGVGEGGGEEDGTSAGLQRHLDQLELLHGLHLQPEPCQRLRDHLQRGSAKSSSFMSAHLFSDDGGGDGDGEVGGAHPQLPGPHLEQRIHMHLSLHSCSINSPNSINFLYSVNSINSINSINSLNSTQSMNSLKSITYLNSHLSAYIPTPYLPTATRDSSWY